MTSYNMDTVIGHLNTNNFYFSDFTFSFSFLLNDKEVYDIKVT